MTGMTERETGTDIEELDSERSTHRNLGLFACQISLALQLSFEVFELLMLLLLHVNRLVLDRLEPASGGA
jgi:hypothetical protein